MASQIQITILPSTSGDLHNHHQRAFEKNSGCLENHFGRVENHRQLLAAASSEIRLERGNS
jgi:hypothetical protein